MTIFPKAEEAIERGDMERARDIVGCAPSLMPSMPIIRKEDDWFLGLWSEMVSRLAAGSGFQVMQMRIAGVGWSDAIEEVWERVSLIERVVLSTRERLADGH